MKLSEYRDTFSWQGAVGLGPYLMGLAEELPASEELGLSLQLRQIMIELPTAIAEDLVEGSQTRHRVVMKLAAVMEIIDQVYPALDTVTVRAAIEKLENRIGGPSFTERRNQGEDDAPTAQAQAAERPTIMPQPAITRVSVPVSAGQLEENHVQPDSVQ